MKLYARIACLLLLALSGCGGEPPGTAERRTALRVMSFNIEWGGTHVSFENVIETIRQSGADVVGIQEAEGNLVRLSDALGWHYDRWNYVISRYPLLDPPGAGGRYVLVEVSPGKVMAQANVHLPSDPYGPDLIRDGAGIDAVLANEAALRLPELAPYIDMLPALVAGGMPVVVTGDFNSPAHTDWTDAMVGKRPFLRYPVAWPVSLAMEKAGFRDTWREVFPDPQAHPGLTWWAGRPPLPDYAPGENDAQDRIDFIWHAGPIAAKTISIAGEQGGPEVSLGMSPWPSDHRAIYADFELEPAPVPDLVTTDRRVYTQGMTVSVSGRFPSTASAEISVFDNRSGTTVFSEAVNSVSVELDLPALSPGEYLVSAKTAGHTLDRTIWVLAPDAVPELAVERTDTTVMLRWSNTPGNRNDYIVLYDAGETDIEEGMLGYVYTGARPHGEVDVRALPIPTLDSSASYVARLLKDDGYEVLAETTPFSIEGN